MAFCSRVDVELPGSKISIIVPRNYNRAYYHLIERAVFLGWPQPMFPRVIYCTNGIKSIAVLLDREWRDRRLSAGVFLLFRGGKKKLQE